jgi:hypothetical protein
MQTLRTLRIAMLGLCLAAPAFAQGSGGSDMHMDMNHMRMTAHQPAAPGDSARAAQVLATLRTSLAPYQDYHKALADGYRIFLPRIQQPVYHFTNRAITRAGVKTFDPAHPGSLLYEKTSDSTYKLVGAMYIAAKAATPDDLNARLPLSIATWHAHTNFCVPQPLLSKALWAKRDSTGKRLFGFRGSIATADACAAASGKFHPQVFGWMVHVYPFAPTWAEVWATDEVPTSADGMTNMRMQ